MRKWLNPQHLLRRTLPVAHGIRPSHMGHEGSQLASYLEASVPLIILQYQYQYVSSCRSQASQPSVAVPGAVPGAVADAVRWTAAASLGDGASDRTAAHIAIYRATHLAMASLSSNSRGTAHALTPRAPKPGSQHSRQRLTALSTACEHAVTQYEPLQRVNGRQQQ